MYACMALSTFYLSFSQECTCPKPQSYKKYITNCKSYRISTPGTGDHVQNANVVITLLGYSMSAYSLGR